MENANRRLRFVIDIVGDHDMGDAFSVQKALRDVIRADVSPSVVVQELPSHYHDRDCRLCTPADPPDARDVWALNRHT